MTNTDVLPGTISLIGMPGAGKSTVGVVLAKLCGLAFVDTDLAIQSHAGATLQEILEREGYLHLRELEEGILLGVALDNAVVATGGSVVYSEPAMHRLRAAGPVVYLSADLETLEQRVSAAPLRGIASDAASTFADVFAERTPLYERHADITVDATAGSADTVAALIRSAVAEHR